MLEASILEAKPLSIQDLLVEVKQGWPFWVVDGKTYFRIWRRFYVEVSRDTDGQRVAVWCFYGGNFSAKCEDSFPASYQSLLKRSTILTPN